VVSQVGYEFFPGFMTLEFQATKGARWMPWGKEPKKDAVSGDTLWGAAIEL
jgi:hypothetical protein